MLLASLLAGPLSAFGQIVNAQTWPDTPFTTDSRYIKGASGVNINFAGVNWPGASETMLPEGLQYTSIADTISTIKSLGLNVIRLTYAIQMIDEQLENNPNSRLRNTLTNALGQTNGTTIFNQIIEKNPQFNENTTRLEVFDAVAAEAEKQQIWIHLDNHVSRAEWCCLLDGNAWFGASDFNVYNWTRGLGFMANHTKSWRALSSMSLRNELRPTFQTGAEEYGWPNWYKNMIPAAAGIYANNTLPLIFFSGLGSDTDLGDITKGSDLGNGTRFNISSFPYADKIVYELHNYENSQVNETEITSGLYNRGYGAMNVSDAAFPNHAPVVLTEFGFSFEDGSYMKPYAQAIKSFLANQPGGPGGWMQWVLSGSYYIRLGTQDYDESYGYYNHNWTGFRNQTVINQYVTPLVYNTQDPRTIGYI